MLDNEQISDRLVIKDHKHGDKCDLCERSCCCACCYEELLWKAFKLLREAKYQLGVCNPFEAANHAHVIGKFLDRFDEGE